MPRKPKLPKLDINLLERGFTIREPHIQMILKGNKVAEYRIWELPKQYVNVPIALHAAATNDGRGAFEEWESEGYEIDRKALIHSAVVAVITFTGCEHDTEFDDYAWPIGHIVPLKKPVSCKGQLGFWFLPPAVKKKILSQISGS